MKMICNHCAYQEKNDRGGVTCGKAVYDMDSYGDHKRGGLCIHDSDLSDHFLTRIGNETSVANMSSQIETQKVELMRARDTIKKLQSRLVTVGIEGD